MEILGFSLGILSIILAYILTKRTDELVKTLHKNTNVLVKSEDQRAKELIAKIDEHIRETHCSLETILERMDRRSEQIDRTTKEILGKILEKVTVK